MQITMIVRAQITMSFCYLLINESTEVHNPGRDCAILTLAHETHQTSTV